MKKGLSPLVRRAIGVSLEPSQEATGRNDLAKIARDLEPVLGKGWLKK